MLHYQTNKNSIFASLEGTRKINGKISELVKQEIVDFLGKSGKQVILDLNGISSLDTHGLSLLKAITELARANQQLFELANTQQDVLEAFRIPKCNTNFSIGKN